MNPIPHANEERANELAAKVSEFLRTYPDPSSAENVAKTIQVDGVAVAATRFRLDFERGARGRALADAFNRWYGSVTDADYEELQRASREYETLRGPD
ncbi:hypothetical protein [Mycobacterium sp.]|jgi:hypothetical protein|uniref:hypothetical protein n=1 Tax=Mycobacterium sp. TaxID=1785 RepID=UPI0025F1241B|nr:hypothetical protein [Mycobacterium sp.]